MKAFPCSCPQNVLTRWPSHIHLSPSEVHLCNRCSNRHCVNSHQQQMWELAWAITTLAVLILYIAHTTAHNMHKKYVLHKYIVRIFLHPAKNSIHYPHKVHIMYCVRGGGLYTVGTRANGRSGVIGVWRVNSVTLSVQRTCLLELGW